MRTPRRLAALVVGAVVVSALWFFFAPSALGGSTSYVVTHGISMSPRFHTGDLAILRPQAAYRTGDVIAYRSATLRGVILHRIVEVKGGSFTTKGDHNGWRDPDHPSASDIEGRLWIHVPKVGLIFLYARNHLGIVLGAAVLILIAAGGGTAARSGRSRQTQRGKGGIPVHRGSTRRQLSPLLPWAGGFLAVGVALGLVAFTRPAASPAAGSSSYNQAVSLDYRAAGDRNVYDQGKLTTGDPVYAALNPRIDVDVRYTMSGPHITNAAGTIGLDARLSNNSGWQRTVPVTSPQPFTGTVATLTSRVDVAAMRSLLHDVQRRTGAADGTYTLSLVPTVTAHARFDSADAALAYAPAVAFLLQPNQLVLNTSSTHDRGKPVTMNEAATDTATARGPVEIEMFGHRFQQRHLWGGSGAFGLLALVLGIIGWLRPPRDPLARLSQPVIAATPEVLDHPALSVATLDALLDIAERYDRPLLHVSDGGRSTYLTEEQGTWYRHADRALPATLVPRAAEPAIDAVPEPMPEAGPVPHPEPEPVPAEVTSVIASMTSAIDSALAALGTEPIETIAGQTHHMTADEANQIRHSPRITFIEGDITDQDVDAIVNAANTFLLGGGGVDGAIHSRGGSAILEECRALRAGPYENGLPTGEAVATTGGKLPAQWVIHTVGPVYREPDDAERAALLAACHVNALRIADELGAVTIAFPAISTGVYGWPLQDAARIALRAVRGATTSVREVRFVLHDAAAYAAFTDADRAEA